MERTDSRAGKLECGACGRSYEPEKARNRCDCGGPLEQRYSFDGADRSTRPAPDAFGSGSIWRYQQFLPVIDSQRIVSMNEGGTPLLDLPSMSKRLGLELLVKDEGRNPTGSFKARGASVGLSRLVELGWKSFGMPSVGSGGCAWSAYAAKAGVQMRVGLPDNEELPVVGHLEPPMYGARVDRYEGGLVSAFTEFSSDLPDDALNVGAFAEPYRVDGEKTIMFEICEQLGWQSPDVVIWPTGGAAGLVGLAKGLEEMRAAGWIDANPVTIVAAQHTECGPIAAALRDGLDDPPEYDEHGVAPGVWVGRPNHGRYILERVRGQARAHGAQVDDAQIMGAMRSVASQDGVLLSPEGALAVAAADRLRAEGFLDSGQRVVCVNTATSLRYPHLMSA